MTESTNVIRLGLTNLACETMTQAYKDELPDAVSSLLRAHSRGVELYARQFPEWNRFLENASLVSLSDRDVEELRKATDSIVDSLQNHEELVEPEVPKTLAFLNELLAKPGTAGKRAAFAMLRSIENLVSRVFSYGAQFLEKTVERAIEGGSNVASKVIIVGLLSLAIGGATAISPVAVKVPDMSWMKGAVEVVKRQIDELVD